jgi:hypothetical protein
MILVASTSMLASANGSTTRTDGKSRRKKTRSAPTADGKAAPPKPKASGDREAEGEPDLSALSQPPVSGKTDQKNSGSEATLFFPLAASRGTLQEGWAAAGAFFAYFLGETRK